jgi:hypothetical protein
MNEKAISVITDDLIDCAPKPSLLDYIAPMEDLSDAVHKIPVDYLESSERTLEKEIRKANKGKFDRQLALLKISFWDEYKRAVRQKTTMQLENITWGVCHPQWFKKHVVENSLAAAWLIKPPTEEIILQKELLNLGFKKLRTALSAPIINLCRVVKRDLETGDSVVTYEKRVDIKLLREVHSIVKTLQDRVHGSIVQRQFIKQQTQSMNVNIDQGPAPNDPAARSLADPNLTMEDLEAFERQLLKMQRHISDGADIVTNPATGEEELRIEITTVSPSPAEEI